MKEFKNTLTADRLVAMDCFKLGGEMYRALSVTLNRSEKTVLISAIRLSQPRLSAHVTVPFETTFKVYQKN